MKKYILILIILVSCSSDSVSINPIEPIQSSEEFQPATTIRSDYDKLSSQDKIAVKFRSYWIQNILKTDSPALTEEELRISYDRAENPIDHFEMKDGIKCSRVTSGTSVGSVIDENYPLIFENEIVGDDGYNIVLIDYYYCANEDISFPLFGAPFYQNGDWWIFKEIKNIDFENPGEGVYRRQSSRFRITEFFNDF